MYREQTNSVALRTQKAVAEAFLSLIREQEYRDISVTEICVRADVVRKTFYNNFQTKEDVVCYLIDGFTRGLEAQVDFQLMNIRQMLLIAFREILDNSEMLLLFYQKGLFRFAHKSISAYIGKDRIIALIDGEIVDERMQKYVIAQISAVLISVTETWIENGLKEPVEFLAELTEMLMYKPQDIQARAQRKELLENCITESMSE